MKVQKLGLTIGASVFIVGIAMLGVSASQKPATIKGNISASQNGGTLTPQVEGVTTPAPQPENNVTINAPDTCQKSVTTTPSSDSESGSETNVSVDCNNSSSTSNSSSTDININNSSSQNVSSGSVSSGGTSGNVSSHNSSSINVKTSNQQ